MTEFCHVKHPSRGRDRSSGGNNIKKEKKWASGEGWSWTCWGHRLQERSDQDITRPSLCTYTTTHIHTKYIN